MSESRVRVRFAPSPTGLMHLGNVRTALMNYLFAQQKNGIFVLRIEDTDPQRNFDPQAKHIIEDLKWLGLDYTEGPKKNGPFAPYFQSKRMDIYKEKLNTLVEKNLIYRCFCTTEELDKKRQRQISLRTAPRYDRTCLKLSQEEIQKKLDQKIPFIWRMNLDHTKSIHLKDIAHGDIKFDLKNFSDFPLTRQNGSYTFMFANFVDDMVMEISHVLRGEDHLTNTAGQAALFQAFSKELPTFWHMPILCNIEGKKLSKRDFGFSLKDLKAAGYLPETICNYLAIIGGSFKKEVMSLEELTQSMNFDHAHSKGQIKYDVEKLKWLNHKWIAQYDPATLTQRCKPYLIEAFPQVKKIDDQKLTDLIQAIKTDLTTLADVSNVLKFYFETPILENLDLQAVLDNSTPQVAQIVAQHINTINNPDVFLMNIKSAAKQQELKFKSLFSFLRFALMGATKGPGIKDLIEMLGYEEAEKRLLNLIELNK
ncbi:glutamate--tRNA ligase [bacterium]|nr:glutamate--tRNA ligase [bacterium]